MPFTPATIDLHVVVVEYSSEDGREPTAFVGRPGVAHREALVHLIQLDAGYLKDDAETVIRPLRHLTEAHIMHDATDEWVEEVLAAFHEATTSPWLTDIETVLTLDVSVAR